MNSPQNTDKNIHSGGRGYSIIGDDSYYSSPQLDCVWRKPYVTPNASQMRVMNLAGRYDFEHVRPEEHERARQIVGLAALADTSNLPCTFRCEAEQWLTLPNGGVL